MSEGLIEQLLRAIEQAAALYNRLVPVVAPSGAGKTSALREVAERQGHPYLNVNLELSRALLELTHVQRCLQAPRLLEEIIRETGSAIVLLDNLEVLFDPSLKLGPLRLLQVISRNRTVVAAVKGTSGSLG